MLNNRTSTPQEWKEYDVLILPSGWYESANEDWLTELSLWIQGGGRAIAISSALNLFADSSGWGLQRFDDDVQQMLANDRRA